MSWKNSDLFDFLLFFFCERNFILFLEWDDRRSTYKLPLQGKLYYYLIFFKPKKYYKYYISHIFENIFTNICYVRELYEFLLS